MTIDSRSILLAMLPIGLTLISYAIIRDLLWGIFLGNKSKKTANRLKAEASGWGRLTQSYMKPHLTKYKKDYSLWKTMKLVTVIATIAQLVGFTLMIVLKVQFWIVAIVCAVLSLANVALFIVLMTQTETSSNKKSTKGSPWKFEQ